MRKRVTVGLTGTQDLQRESLASLLREEKYRVVRSVPTLADFNDPRAKQNYDLIIMCANILAELKGDEVCELRDRNPDARIVLIINNLSHQERMLTEEAGIDAVISQSTSRQGLFYCLELTLMGEHVYAFGSPSMATRRHETSMEDSGWPVPASPSRREDNEEPSASATQVAAPLRNGDLPQSGNLSPREWQILACLIKGSSNKVIAREYDITEATVKVHIKTILRKLNVANRTQAAVWAIEELRKIEPQKGDAQDADHEASPPDEIDHESDQDVGFHRTERFDQNFEQGRKAI